jgi:hypothetical protein
MDYSESNASDTKCSLSCQNRRLEVQGTKRCNGILTFSKQLPKKRQLPELAAASNCKTL